MGLPPLRWVAEEDLIYDSATNTLHRPDCPHASTVTSPRPVSAHGALQLVWAPTLCGLPARRHPRAQPRKCAGHPLKRARVLPPGGADEFRAGGTPAELICPIPGSKLPRSAPAAPTSAAPTSPTGRSVTFDDGAAAINPQVQLVGATTNRRLVLDGGLAAVVIRPTEG